MLVIESFNWTKFRTVKGWLKIHTVWDNTLGLPDYINITDAKLDDSKGLDNQIFAKGSIVDEDRVYVEVY